MLYLVTGEYWGATNATRIPSIYWAALKPTDDICKLSREDQGMVASKDGLALAYPVIAGRKKGGAVIAFSFSGNDTMANGLRKAYPGEGRDWCVQPETWLGWAGQKGVTCTQLVGDAAWV